MPADDEEEFTAIVERHARFAFRIAYSLLRNSHDAEDSVQEMFLNLYRKRAWIGLRDERAFIARAVWRTSVDRLRQRPAQAQAAADTALEDLPSAAPDPERLAIASDVTLAVHALVDALPEDLRRPLALSTIDEFNSRHIAEIMGLPEGTVRTRLMRARQLLRDKLTAMEEGPHARAQR